MVEFIGVVMLFALGFGAGWYFRGQHGEPPVGGGPGKADDAVAQ